MLYYLYEYFGVNIFQYITFRAGVGFFLAFMLSMYLMPRFIRLAHKREVKQPISSYVPSHKGKKNTPTMGGVIIVLATIVSSVMTAKLANQYSLLSLTCLIGFCLIGSRDDYTKIIQGKNSGMSAKMKFMLLAVFSLVLSLGLLKAGVSSRIYLPVFKNPILNMDGHKFLCIAFWTIIMLATTNAVNITDGLDGLVTVPSIFSLITLAVFVYIAGNAELSKYLLWPKEENVGEVVVVCLSLVGALVGFLWYNCHPAQLFMGDSGSLAIGGFIAYCSILSNNEVLLLIIGFIFVMETLSVILQIGGYKLRGRRMFLMAPIHHHFEIKGWAENKIIVRFWIIAALSNIVALLTLKIR